MSANFAEIEGDDLIEAGERRDIAMAIKACLESLRTDARAFRFNDLERFLELASLAAAEAAEKADGRGRLTRLGVGRRFGNC